MEEFELWRYTARSITKYDPQFRDAKGHYKKDEWIGFFQIGQVIDNELLTFEHYCHVESKYIMAAKLFLDYHKCQSITVKKLEKNGFSDYEFEDKYELQKAYDKVQDGAIVRASDIDSILKLIFRDLVWAELICQEDIALRFGYDFYMYFNSPFDTTLLEEKVEELGLYVW